jgi:hypothetical protein
MWQSSFKFLVSITPGINSTTEEVFDETNSDDVVFGASCSVPYAVCRFGGKLCEAGHL